MIVYVRLVLSLYDHDFLDKDVPEDALHKIHLDAGISKVVVDGALEEWECQKEIRVVDAARRSNSASKREKHVLVPPRDINSTSNDKIRRGGLLQILRLLSDSLVNLEIMVGMHFGLLCTSLAKPSANGCIRLGTNARRERNDSPRQSYGWRESGST